MTAMTEQQIPPTRDWEQIIQGTNLGAGKAARFAPEPRYRRTTDGTESTKLTDGVWEDVFLPGSKTAVGWAYVDGQINILFDLGKTEAIGTIVARFQGGNQFFSIIFPRQINVLLSDDGKHYFRAASLTRVTGGESELAKARPDLYFHLPETGTSYIHPFILGIERKARFVALNINPGVHALFSDEIFIMQSENPADCPGLEGLEPAPFVSRGVQVQPKWPELVITTNVVTPNTFTVTDLRSEEARKQAATVFFELPHGIELRMGRRGTARKDPEAGGINRWIVEDLWDPQLLDWQGMEGPVFFIPTDGAEFPDDAVVIISTDDPDSEVNTVEAPIRFIEVPEAKPLGAFHISLTWMLEAHSYTYPQFFEAFRHLGFTGLGFFPRDHRTEEERRKLAEFARAARKEGFEIIYNESPFHVMEQIFSDQPEILTQLADGPGKHLCPTYAGEFYRKEMERVRDNALLIQPDIVFWDIELWYRSAPEWKRCKRCQEAFKASGAEDWESYLIAQGTRMIRDLHEAITGTGPEGATPIAGSYNIVADPPVYHELFAFEDLYPRYLQFGMPVLYVRGDMRRVHDVTRANHLAMGNRDIIPWITAGTYGEFPPPKIAQQIFELALNGAKGGTYYRFQDNDPMDYYYQAVALNALAPHQRLLETGGMLEVIEADEKLTTSAWGDNREALLLFGNYTENGTEQTAVAKIAGKKIHSLTDVLSGETLSPDSAVAVPAGGQRLLHCRFD